MTTTQTNTETAMTTNETIELTADDAKFTNTFAAKVSHLIGNVAVAPNNDCRKAAWSYVAPGSRVAKPSVSLSVELDDDDFTVYRIGDDLLLIDAEDNSTTDIGDLRDDDDADEVIAKYPAAAELARKIVADYNA